MSEEDNESHWPGYVDALSNMVLALIFVVMVLSLALSQYAQMSARQIAEEMIVADKEAKGGASQRQYEVAQPTPAKVATTARQASAEAQAIAAAETPNEPSAITPLAAADASPRPSTTAVTEPRTQEPPTDPTLSDVGVQMMVPPQTEQSRVVRVKEDTSHRFEQNDIIDLDDPDADPSEVELSVLNGTLTVEQPEGLDVSGQASGRLVLRGPQDRILRAFDSLSYQGSRDFFGKDNLVLRATDAGGRETVSVALVTVTPINDPPVGEDGSVTAYLGQAYVFSERDFPFMDVEDDRLSGVRLERSVNVGQLMLGSQEVMVGNIISADRIRRGELVYLQSADDSPLTPITFSVTVIDGGGVEDGGLDTAERPAQISVDLVAVVGSVQSAALNMVSDLPRQDPGEAMAQNPSVTPPDDQIREQRETALPEIATAKNQKTDDQDPDPSATSTTSQQDPTRPGATNNVGNALDARIKPDLNSEEVTAPIAPSSVSRGMSGEIVIQFPDRVVALDDATTQAMLDQIRLLGETSELRLSLVVLSPYPDLTIERSAAMTRGISVWQELVAAGVRRDAITIRVEQERRSARLGEVRIARAAPGSGG